MADEARTASSRDDDSDSHDPPARIKIVVIDQAGILRDGLVALLETEPAFSVAGVAASRRDALTTIAACSPSVVLMDFSIAMKTSPDTVALLKKRWPELRVVVVSLRQEEYLIESALRAGADGYVLKTDTHTDLFNAVRRAASGRGYLSPRVLENLANPQQRTTGRTGAAPVLTSREQEVITLIARGHRTREIAHQMSLSHKTVEKHRTNLMRKLGLRSAAAVAAYAITHGYL